MTAMTGIALPSTPVREMSTDLVATITTYLFHYRRKSGELRVMSDRVHRQGMKALIKLTNLLGMARTADRCTHRAFHLEDVAMIFSVAVSTANIVSRMPTIPPSLDQSRRG